jgi:hypothetical protein
MKPSTAMAVVAVEWVTWAAWACNASRYLNHSFDEEASAGNCRGFFFERTGACVIGRTGFACAAADAANSLWMGDMRARL